MSQEPSCASMKVNMGSHWSCGIESTPQEQFIEQEIDHLQSPAKGWECEESKGEDIQGERESFLEET